MENKVCRFGHECSSGCQKDFDCPCQSDHCCALTENCEGREHCDDHYQEKSLLENLKNHLEDLKNPLGMLGK